MAKHPHRKGMSAARYTKQVAQGKVRRAVSTGIWHQPGVLNLLADILMLFAFAVFGWALVVWTMSRPWLPLKEMVVVSPLKQVSVAQIEYAASKAIRGNFFTINLDLVRQTVEALPWVRHAEVRRRWPDGLELSVEEYEAVACWMQSGQEDMQLVNRQGEVFVAACEGEMLHLSGPQGTALRLLERHEEFSKMLVSLGVKLEKLALSEREAWQLKFDNGMLVVLGREQEKETINRRLARFVTAWPQVQAETGIKVAVVDLRYPGGFALTPGQPVAVKGKE